MSQSASQCLEIQCESLLAAANQKPSELYEALEALSKRAIGAEKAELFLLQKDRSHLVPSFQLSEAFEPTPVSCDIPLFQAALSTGKAQRLNAQSHGEPLELRGLPHALRERMAGTRSLLALPLGGVGVWCCNKLPIGQRGRGRDRSRSGSGWTWTRGLGHEGHLIGRTPGSRPSGRRGSLLAPRLGAEEGPPTLSEYLVLPEHPTPF